MSQLIQFALRSRLLMMVLGSLVLAAGYYSYGQLPVDAFPDVTPALVQVFTVTEGLAPEEVEKYITYPVEVAMNGLPRLRQIRSVSNFGLSVVNIYFEDGTDIYFARQLVNERLQLAREEIPKGFGEPEMGPISTGMGQILFYFVEDESGKRSQEEMRQIQDWLIKFNLQTVAGVTEVLSLGGEVKQFQVLVRPDDLLRYDLSLNDVVQAVKANNANVGAQFIVKNAEMFLVRSVGLGQEPAQRLMPLVPDLEDMPVAVKELKDAGFAAKEAWEIWQKGFEYVDPAARPTIEGDPEIAFARYIREKVDLLTRQQAKGKLHSRTGFLLNAIKKNYANSAFAEVEQQQRRQQERQAQEQRARQRQRLEDNKAQLEKSRRADLHTLCKDLIAHHPALAEEALAAVLEQESSYKKHLHPGKTAAENYRDAILLWMFVDEWLEAHYPEHFEAIRTTYDASLTDTNSKLDTFATGA